MITNMTVTVWDSLTGETSAHHIKVGPDQNLSVFQYDQLAQFAHESVCRETGENPDDWIRDRCAPVWPKGPCVITSVYTSKDQLTTSVEIVLIENHPI